MVEAFSGQTGVMKAVDYRQRSVYGAYAYVPSLATALVVKVDTHSDRSTSHRNVIVYLYCVFVFECFNLRIVNLPKCVILSCFFFDAATPPHPQKSRLSACHFGFRLNAC